MSTKKGKTERLQKVKQKDTNNNYKNDNNDKNKTLDDFFNSVWELYPRKEGRNSISKSKKEELFKIGYDKLKKAIENYKKDRYGVEKRFILQGSTFFNGRYFDYLPNETEPIKPKELIYNNMGSIGVDF